LKLFSKPFALSILLFAFLFLLTINGCKEPTEPVTGNVTIAVEDASCTEVWLAVNTGNIQLPGQFVLYENNTRKTEITFTQRDTVIVIENLLPKQNYSYKLMNSNNVSNETLAITMDTTTYNFNWETIEFGGQASSILFDVAIIDENNIWAVGDIYTEDSQTYDSLGNWIDAYNAVHWNGVKWELKRIPTIICGVNTPVFAPLNSVIAFDANSIFFTDGGEVIYFNGLTYKQDCSINSLLTGKINKLWGKSSNDLYAVGNLGNIAHWNGSRWTKIESGTTLNIYDIYEGSDGNPVAIATNTDGAGNENLLLTIDSKTKTVTGTKIDTPVYSMIRYLNINKRKHYLCGAGVYSSTTLKNKNWKKENTLNYYTTGISGGEYNSIICSGVYGYIGYWNGKRWINTFYPGMGAYPGGYSRVVKKGDIVVMTGQVDKYQGINQHSAIITWGQNN
jgi:hypothetical protein